MLFPICAGVAVGAHELVLVVLGPQWDLAVGLVPWLLVSLAQGVAASSRSDCILSPSPDVPAFSEGHGCGPSTTPSRVMHVELISSGVGCGPAPAGPAVLNASDNYSPTGRPRNRRSNDGFDAAAKCVPP
jgi:hypothetical protein